MQQLERETPHSTVQTVSLFVPVFTYGCQIWLFDTDTVKIIASITLFTDNRTSFNNIASDHTERIH